MNKFLSVIHSYILDEEGVVTLEWIGIAAVVVVASIAISAFLLQSADGFAGSVAGVMDNAADAIDGDGGGG